MLFSLSTVALMAASSTLAQVVPASGTVKMDLARHPMKHAFAVRKQALSRRAAPFEVPLVNNPYEGGGFYFVNISVGTPPQSLALDIDTGSSDIWMFGQQACAELYDGCEGGSFDESSSSSLNVDNRGGFSIRYQDGSGVTGDYVRDTLTVGGKTVKNLTMAIATQAKSVNTGIMGIGFSLDESIVAQQQRQGKQANPYPNLIDLMKSQGLIDTRSYSLYLDDLRDSTGSILFGGYDSDKFVGELGVLPIQKDSATGLTDTFSVVWNSLAVTANGSSTVLSSSSTPNVAILDSGTSITIVPSDIFDQVSNYLGVQNNPYYGYIIRCDVGGMTGSLSYQMGSANGPIIAVDFSELALPLVDESGSQIKDRNGQAVCLFGIQPQDLSSNDPILFGDTFLRSAYVVYDLDASQIGIAPTKFNVSTSNIKPITAGAGQTLSGGTFLAPTKSIAQSQTARVPFNGGGSSHSTASSAFSGSDSNSAIPGISFNTGSSSQATGAAALSGYTTVYSNLPTQAAATSASSSTSTGAGVSNVFMHSGLGSMEKAFMSAFGSIALLALGAGLIL